MGDVQWRTPQGLRQVGNQGARKQRFGSLIHDYSQSENGYRLVAADFERAVLDRCCEVCGQLKVGSKVGQFMHEPSPVRIRKQVAVSDRDNLSIPITKRVGQ